jgi:hypothetical protein
MLEVRCDNKKFGELIASNGESTIEFKCNSKFCGHNEDTIVIHRFLLLNGAVRLLGTRKYKAPENIKSKQLSKGKS